jgi:hypothetical protein
MRCIVLQLRDDYAAIAKWHSIILGDCLVQVKVPYTDGLTFPIDSTDVSSITMTSAAEMAIQQ